jgi:hypothetical protein
MRASRGIFLKRSVIFIGLILAAGIAFAIGIVNPHTEQQEILSPGFQAELAVALRPAEDFQPSRAERITRALVQAYPGRITQVEFRNGDWAVLLRGTWFYYAGGRMMPGQFLYRMDNYRPLAFYDSYPRYMPAWTPPTPEQADRFRGASASRAALLPRAPYFFDTLYQARSREESSRRVTPINFLGRRVTVHNDIIQELGLVEARIMAAARTDAQVQTWVNEIDRMYGWNWRNVGGTQSRSFHAYGVAVDIIPRNLGGRAIYWRWAGPNWWNIPHERRHHPPDAVVQAFESYGFVWGGKWSFFDTIHFEFRPEVMILAGIELTTVAR